METTSIATTLQRTFYMFFHQMFLSSLSQATRIFPETPELNPSVKGSLVVRAFVHATCAATDENGRIVPTVTKERFLESMASQYDQTMTDMQVTNASSDKPEG